MSSNHGYKAAPLATFLISSRGDVTSRATVSAPASARSAILEVLRALAMTLWPRDRASRAMYLPKPDEAAVMNQTGPRDIVMFKMDGVCCV